MAQAGSLKQKMESIELLEHAQEKQFNENSEVLYCLVKN